MIVYTNFQKVLSMATHVDFYFFLFSEDYGRNPIGLLFFTLEFHAFQNNYFSYIVWLYNIFEY